MTLVLGVDVGTTAVKCALLRAEDQSVEASAGITIHDMPERALLTVHELEGQDVAQVLIAVDRAFAALPEDLLQQVASISICGQMHGIVWWNCASVGDQLKKALSGGNAASPACNKATVRAWSRLVTWQDQRCSPAFLEECATAIVKQETQSMSSPLSTGYGLATYAHTLKTNSKSLEGFDGCGTIMDFIAFLLCGHTAAEQCTMDPTNAFSWGGFDLRSKSWNPSTVQALGIPLDSLPAIKRTGERIGQTQDGFAFGLPAGKAVYVPMGDHPCSVLATKQLADANTTLSNPTLLNIGTSAQLAMLLTKEDIATIEPSKSFEVRPYLYEDSFVGVAASLSGGNIYAWFIQQCQQWLQELQPLTSAPDSSIQDDAAWYRRLIALGFAKQSTTLEFRPTLNGERSTPTIKGSIQELCTNNWSLGDISAALCKGLIGNLFEMVPLDLQSQLSTRALIGTGNALVRNELLQHFLRERMQDPEALRLASATDAAVGAALVPLVLVRI